MSQLQPGVITGDGVDAPVAGRLVDGSRPVDDAGELPAEDFGPYLTDRHEIDDGSMTGSRHDRPTTTSAGGRPRLQPRWFVVGFWHAHRALLRATRGRLGLWRPKPDGWGTLWLTTTGRRSGQQRRVVLGYVEDGDNLVTMAMNGWGAAEPAWWLNLQAHPDATVRTRDGVREVRARRAPGAERERLWARWAEIDKNLDAYAAMRPAETAVVVFEPADSAGPVGDGP